MYSTLYVRSAKALAAAAALSLLLAAGPGGGRGPGARQQNGQGGQGNQQCPPGQGASGQGASGQGASGQGGGQGNGGSGQLALGAPGEQGGNGQNQGPGGQGPDQGQGPQNRQRQQGQTLTGTVSGYNLNPGGTPESMMLKTANSTVQLNFPPEMAGKIQSAGAVGSDVSVVARSGEPGGMGGPGGQNGPGGQGGPDNQQGQQQSDHEVMNLESIKTATGQSINVGGPGSGQSGQVDGTVKQLNYDRRGQVNGAQLSSGVFVHLRPGSQADLTVGEKVTVEGRERKATSGMKIIEAQSINGTSVDDNGPGGGGGPGDNGAPPGGGGNGGPGQ